jgi:hypothetical protein
MFAQRKNLIKISSLVAMVLLCVFAGTSLSPNIKGFLTNGDQAPIREVKINIDQGQRDELFSQMQKFAGKHAYEFHLTFYDSAKENFLVALYRTDFTILATNIPNSPKEIRIGLYNESSTPPSQESLDTLFNDLKGFIGEIPNVMMTEQRRGLTITIDESRREELFTQLRKLADNHSLEFTLSFSSDKSLFLAEIHGNGFHITSSAKANYPREISVDFYLDYYKDPTPISQETVDELFDELKSLLSEIQNISITEEK